MTNVMVPIRSVKQYFKEFGENALIKEGARPSMVREQILDAFQKEIFGQITLKYHDASILAKPTDTISDETREGIRNILKNADRKFRRLCIEFSKNKETYNVIQPRELLERMQDVIKIQEETAKNPDEIPVDMVPDAQPVIL